MEGPVITNLIASPDVLWPPNHKMVPVVVTATATDNCGSAPVVSLRAERSGPGDGRLYSVTDTCTDGSGNSASAIVGVLVPHSQ